MSDIVNNDSRLDLFKFFVKLYVKSEPSHIAASSYSNSFQEATKFFNKDTSKDASPVDILEVRSFAETDHELELALLKNGFRQFYVAYTDFVIHVRRKLEESGLANRKDYLLQPTVSPDKEAYEMIGFNELNISPKLSSYANLF